MKLNMYATYDRVATCYSNPYAMNERTAQRNFRWMTDEAELKDCEDKEVHLIGWYDNENGDLVGCKPEKVFDIEAAKKKKLEE